MSWRLAAALLAGRMLLAAGAGLAQGAPSDLALLEDRAPTQAAEIVADPRPAAGVELGIELGYGAASSPGGAVHVLAPAIGVRWALDRALILGVDWPWTLGAVETDGGAPTRTDVRSGNPGLSVLLARPLDRGYYAFGLAVTLPLASSGAGPGRLTGASIARAHAAAAAAGMMPDADLVGALNLATAAHSSGLMDLARYSPDQITFAAPVRVELQAQSFVVGGELRLPVSIATAAGQGDDFFPALALLIAGRSEPVVWGVRPQMVWLLTEDGAWNDEVQLSLAPFVQVDLQGRGFVYARGLVNLDEPLGVFGGGLSAWRLSAGAGLRW